MNIASPMEATHPPSLKRNSPPTHPKPTGFHFVSGFGLITADFIMMNIASTKSINGSLRVFYNVAPAYCLGKGFLNLSTRSLFITFGCARLTQARTPRQAHHPHRAPNGIGLRSSAQMTPAQQQRPMASAWSFSLEPKSQLYAYDYLGPTTRHTHKNNNKTHPPQRPPPPKQPPPRKQLLSLTTKHTHNKDPHPQNNPPQQT